MSEPVGSSAVAVFEGLPDGLPDGGFAAELPGSVAVGWSESRVKYQPATPTATNKRIEAARATHLPVRLRTVPVRTEPRSLPDPAGSDGPSSLVHAGAVDSTGGTGGDVSSIDGFAASRRTSFKVSFSTLKSRRVSKLTGLISTAWRRVKAARSFGNSCGAGILALSTRMGITRTSSRFR